MALARKAAISLLVAGVAILSALALASGLAVEAASRAHPVLTAQFVPPVKQVIPPQSGPNCRIARTRYCKIGVDCPRLLIAACIAPARPVTHADGTVYCEHLICN